MPSGPSPRLLIASYFPRSLELEGQGTFVRGLSQGLSEAGWEVGILLPEDKAARFEADRVLTYRPGGLRGLLDYRRALARHSAEADATISLENNPGWAALAASVCPLDKTLFFFLTPSVPLRAALKMGFSRQAVLHGLGKNPLLGHAQAWAHRTCAVASEFQAAQLRAYGAREVHVLPGCAHTRRESAPSRAEARAQLGWDERPVVGYLGHYSRAKGVDILVDAFATRQGPERLALAWSGKGRLIADRAAKLARLKEAGRVVELGVVSPPVFLSACDVIALPYVTGSVYHLPMVLLESYAAAVPVITTRVGGVPEIVHEGRTGWLVEPRNADALNAAISDALDDRTRASAYGRHARELFEAELCREVLCARLTAILGRERREGDP